MARLVMTLEMFLQTSRLQVCATLFWAIKVRWISSQNEAISFWDAFRETTQALWPEKEPWRENFLARVLQDSASFAAMEMIRRMVGMAHVTDIDTLALPQRFDARERLGRNARWLALGRPVRTIEELWERAIQD